MRTCNAVRSWRKRGVSRQEIKLAAVGAMTLNHVAEALLPHGTALFYLFQYIGYFTAVAMCFFLAEGFRFTSSKRRYGGRLLGSALLSQLPFMWTLQAAALNMMFTLFLCFLLLIVQTDPRFLGKRMAPSILLILASSFCDWPVMAPLFTLLFWNAGEEREARKRACGYVMVLYVVFSFINTCGIVYGPAEALFRAVLSAAGPGAACLTILFLYNGKESRRPKQETGLKAERTGKGSKWFFYLYYPAHLLLIWAIRAVAGEASL